VLFVAEDFSVGGGGNNANEALPIEKEIDFKVRTLHCEFFELLPIGVVGPG
jgi:hypothetical protein